MSDAAPRLSAHPRRGPQQHSESRTERPADAQHGRRLGPTLAGFAATRLIGNLFVRFPYVFITAIAKGLGISVEALTAILGVRELGGLVAPLTGRWFDAGHDRRIIVVGGTTAGVACAAGAIPHAGWFTVAMVIGGAAKISVDLTHNAWLGHHVALERRGRVGGLLEMTWAGAFLAGVPAVGFLVDRFGWRAAFLVTGPVLALCAVVSGATLQPGAARPPTRIDGTEETDEASPDRSPENSRLKPAVLVFCAMQPLAQMLVFAVNGDWFATTLGLSIPAIASVGLALGVAELAGTALALSFVDRIGPLRCGTWSMLFAVAPILAIVASGSTLWLALGLMIVMDIAIEFGFVSVLPLFSELDTENRGKAVGRVFVVIMVSRAIGSVFAGAIYGLGGFNASLVAAAVACAGAGATLAWADRA